VELARLVRRRCTPEVVAAVESGLITVSTAAKLAKAYPGTQQRIVKKVEKGRPVLEVLAEIGFQDRRPPKFDDGVFKKLLDRFQRLLDLRSGHPCYPTARQRLKELQDSMRWWKRSASRKPRQFFDGHGRPLLERTSAAFALFEEHRDTCYEISSLISRIEKLSRKEGGQCIPAKDLGERLKEVRDIFTDAIPKQVCYCGGYSDSCSSCGGRGWVPVRGSLACDPHEELYSQPTS
jgi:hypothetical protein